VLSQYLARSGLKRAAGQRQLAEAWRQAVGEEAARHTRVAGLWRNVLTVEVDSAPRLQELAAFHKAGILLRLGQLLGTAYVRDIRFRTGNESAQPPGALADDLDGAQPRTDA
jgi:predicted nucleic acid-binding Zn ribbon protein